MTTKVCATCGVEKGLEHFDKQKNRPSHRKHCKICRYAMRDREKEKARHRHYMTERRKNDPVKVRQLWERSVYGVCKEDMAHTQCQICGSTLRLCIDHDHKTGAVRGILCYKCNIGLGMFEDDIAKLAQAILYMQIPR